MVLSDNGILSCYDEVLQLQWKVSIYENSLINLSNLVISNGAIYISNYGLRDAQNVLYVTISFSLSPKHLVKACTIFEFSFW